jgi:hypothetical protein
MGIRSDFPGIVFRSSVKARHSVLDPIGGVYSCQSLAIYVTHANATGKEPITTVFFSCQVARSDRCIKQ